MYCRIAIVFTVFMVKAGFASQAQNSTQAKQIAEYVAQSYATGQLHGAVLVAREGKIIYEGGVGEANSTWGIPNGPDVKYGLASITKTLTAILVIQQAERGVIRLDDPVKKFLPKLARLLDSRITIGHLLSHRSGIVDFANDLSWAEYEARYLRKRVPPATIVADMLALPLEFEPGEKSDYSNTGYVLLGVLLEAVTGQSYCKLLQEKIFEPAKMTDSGCRSFEAVTTRMATQYVMENGQPLHVQYDHSVYADGMAYSTVRDLLRLDIALREGRLLPPDWQARMAKLRVQDGWIKEHYGQRPSLGYGYGMAIWKMEGAKSSEKVTVIGHGGAGGGLTTVYWRVPEDGIVVAVMSNRSIRPFPTYDALLNIVYGRLPTQQISANE